MGKMGWRGVAGIMEEVALVAGADSVQGGQGVAVWVGVVTGRAGVAWPQDAGEGRRRWGWEWTFPRQLW